MSYSVFYSWLCIMYFTFLKFSWVLPSIISSYTPISHHFHSLSDHSLLVFQILKFTLLLISELDIPRYYIPYLPATTHIMITTKFHAVVQTSLLNISALLTYSLYKLYILPNKIHLESLYIWLPNAWHYPHLIIVILLL